MPAPPGPIGAFLEMGADIGVFEDRLSAMLIQSDHAEPAGLHFQAS
jgi:hypothetical protein